MEYNKSLKKIVIAGTVLVLVLACYVGIPKAGKIVGDNKARGYYSTSFEQLLDYAAKNTDNIYFLDANSLANVSRLKNEHEGASIAFLGGWLPGCPVEQEILTKHGIENPTNHLDVWNNDSVYYIFKDSDVTTEDYLVDFYSQYADLKSKEVDYISTDCGINFRVVRIYEDK